MNASSKGSARLSDPLTRASPAEALHQLCAGGGGDYPLSLRLPPDRLLSDESATNAAADFLLTNFLPREAQKPTTPLTCLFRQPCRKHNRSPSPRMKVTAAALAVESFPSRSAANDSPRSSGLVCNSNENRSGEWPQLVEVRGKN